MRKRAAFRRFPRVPHIVTDRLPAQKKRRGVRFLSLPAPPVWPASVAALCRGCERSRAHPPGHFIHQAARFPKTNEREIQPRLSQLLVPKPAIQAVPRHEAHLVVQERPACAAPFVAIRDEVDRYLSEPLVRPTLVP